MRIIEIRAHGVYDLFVVLCLVMAWTAQAQGGPPFRTDDPETPGNRHWEINVGFIGEHNPGSSNYQTPDFDVNYGWGDRIQLKYELPIASNTDDRRVTRTGLGNSLLGVKYRFYEHSSGEPLPGEEKRVNFSLSTYPQVVISHPTDSVRRGVVDRGPQYLLPLESNMRFGPVRADIEAGYWFGNRQVADSWIRGLVLGHEFTQRTELYAEIYDQQDANRIRQEPKRRDATLGAGGRHWLNSSGTLLLLFMGGRSFQQVSRTNDQHNWIAYLGVQMLLGPKESHPNVEPKLPVEK